MIKELIEQIKALDKDFDKEHEDNAETNDYFINGWKLAITRIRRTLEPYKIYDELIEKVSSWWDEVYPAIIFPVKSEEEDRDIGAVKVAEIRELLDKINSLFERGKK